MERILIVILIILLLICVAFSLYIRMYRLNIKGIIDSFDLILNEDTNQLLTVTSTQKDIVELVNRINAVIKESRSSVIAMKRLNKNFRESITSISHDLRTPLTTAGGYVQMLKDDKLTKEEENRYIDIIEERQKTVKVLLEQLFEYARIEAGEIEYIEEEIDVNRILAECLSMYYDDFVNKGQEPEIDNIDSAAKIIGDVNGVKRVFQNIIYNSLVHGEHSYHIGFEEKNGGYLYTFTNSSEYMSNEELLDIFDRFYTKDKSRTKKSTGLGLSIASQIVKRMKGRIYADYENGCISICVWFAK